MFIKSAINGSVRAANVLNLNRKLVKLSIVFRHGDRLPMLSDLPIESYKNVTFDQPPESLTEAGAQRSRNLGTKLRKQYKSFLGMYNPNEVEAYSSPIQRCKDTFMNMSKTLYNLNANEDIPYRSPDLFEDKLIATFVSNTEILDKENYPIDDPNDLQFFKKIADQIGIEITNYRDAVALQDYFKVMNEIGHGMPEWASENWENFNKLYLSFWTTLANKYAERGAGNLIHKIAKDSVSVKRSRNPKVHLYSGHDYNIVTLLYLLKSFDATLVNYCSYIAFEVYKPLVGPHYIEIYFDNEDGKGRRQVQIPGCQFRCSVSNFLEFAEQFYAADECCANI